MESTGEIASASRKDEKIEALQREIDVASSEAQDLRAEILKHYLYTYILFSNLTEEEQEASAMKENLTRLTILLEKLANIQKRLERAEPRQVVMQKLVEEKNRVRKRGNNTNPRVKYRKNAKKLRERTAVVEDFNISAGREEP